MNKILLNTENQYFINNNLNSDIPKLVLSNTSKEVIEQIEAKKRSRKKLPTWFATKNIYYPNKLNIEQTSSEVTASYKAKLISGNSIIDLTGGFGVDCFYFSKRFKTVTHCEINAKLSKIVAHNYMQLKVKNISCLAKDGINALQTINKTFNYIYIDPSRRDKTKGKVFLLNDCIPNVPKNLDLLFKYSKNIIIKTSPLLDISSGINELKCVKEIHCIAVNNEVKELLWILEKKYTLKTRVVAINLKKQDQQQFSFYLNQESNITITLNKPLCYLYEPNAAILKTGAFNSVAQQFNLNKLHKHSHLYTNEKLIAFPGRSFKIIEVLPYNKKAFKQKFKPEKANITTRNFPETVAQIRKKLKIKEGGNDYLFFTTDCDNNKIIIITEKT